MLSKALPSPQRPPMTHVWTGFPLVSLSMQHAASNLCSGRTDCSALFFQQKKDCSGLRLVIMTAECTWDIWGAHVLSAACLKQMAWVHKHNAAAELRPAMGDSCVQCGLLGALDLPSPLALIARRISLVTCCDPPGTPLHTPLRVKNVRGQGIVKPNHLIQHTCCLALQ